MTAAPPDSEAGKTKRRRVSVVFLVVGALALIAGLVILGSRFIHSRLSTHAPGSGAAPTAAPLAEAVPTQPVAPRLTEHKVELRSGMTIAQVLTRHGFTPTEADALYEQSLPVYDLRRLRAGQDIRLFADTEGKIQRLEYDISDVQYISVERRGGRFEASLKERALVIQIREVWGVVKESLILSFNELGEEDPLALAFAELFRLGRRLLHGPPPRRYLQGRRRKAL